MADSVPQCRRQFAGTYPHYQAIGAVEQIVLGPILPRTGESELRYPVGLLADLYTPKCPLLQ